MAASLCSLTKSKIQKFEKIVPQNLITYEKSFGSECFGRIFFLAVCVTHDKKARNVLKKVQFFIQR